MPESLDALQRDLERDFIEASRRRSAFLQAGKPRAANKEYDKVHALKNKLRTLPDRGEAVLERIAKSEDLDLRILVAAALLALDELFAEGLLEEIAAPRDGLNSFEAEMTLREWRRGTLSDHWA